MIERWQRQQRHHEPDRQRHERHRRESLHPPVMHAGARRARPQHPPQGAAQAHGARPPANQAQYATSSISATLTRSDQPGAPLRLRALEPAAGVPDEVADAGDEVIAGADDERGVDQLRERQRQQPLRARLRARSARHRHQPVHQQQQARRQAEAGEAIENRCRQGVLELVHREVRRERSRRHRLKIDAAAVLFPVAEARGLSSGRAADLARTRGGRCAGSRPSGSSGCWGIGSVGAGQ